MTLFILLFVSSCAGTQNIQRTPSSTSSNNLCSQSVEAFFSRAARDEVATLSESGLIEKGLLETGEIRALRNDPVYKNIFYAEDESLRGESAKIVALIRRYRPELEPKKVIEFYHSLFHSCRI